MPSQAASEKNTANLGMDVLTGTVMLVDGAPVLCAACTTTGAYVAANAANSSSLRLG